MSTDYPTTDAVDRALARSRARQTAARQRRDATGDRIEQAVQNRLLERRAEILMGGEGR